MTKRPLVLIVIAYIFFIILFRPFLENIKNRRYNLSEGKTVTVVGVVESQPKIYGNSMGFDLKVSGYTIKAFTPIFDCQYGYRIKLKGKTEKQKRIKNPGLNIEDGGWAVRAFDVPQIIDKRSYNPVKKAIYSVRNHLLGVVQKCLPEDLSALLSGLLFGKSASNISDEVKEDFKRTGTVHLLVVSGLHLSILIGTCFAVLSAFRIPMAPALLLTTFINLTYMLLAGAASSVMRAALMAELTLIAKLFDRDKDFFTAISLAALIILLFDPLVLFNIGFQLSFMATFSLVCLAPLIQERLKALPGYLSTLLSVSLAPVLATFPVIYYNFSQVSLVAPLANMLILPWIQFLIILGFLTVLLGAIFIPLGQFVAASVSLMLVVLKFIVSSFARLSFACIYLPAPPFILILGYYLSLICFLGGKLSFKLNRKKLLFAALLLLAFLVWGAALSPVPGFKDPLEVVILDVGQGDSIFIQSPAGKTMLVDGGDKKKRDMGKEIVVPYLHKRGLNKLDIVALTHPHSDHVGGLLEVLNKMTVGLVLDAGIPCQSKMYLRFLSIIDDNKIPFKIVKGGDVLDLKGGVKAYILHPTEPLIEESALNNNSIVMRIVYKDIAILLTGDLEIQGEEEVLSSGMELQSQIIKVGHHGSKTASGSALLKAVKPEIAVISCGRRNRFKHPHKEALERIKECGARIYRTDQHGAITIKTDGKKYIVKKTAI